MTAARPVGLSKIDDMFGDAARLVVSTQIGAASHLQRNLEIGYVKAARLMEQLEAAGIVGPPVGINPRKVLMELMEELERKLEAYTNPESLINNQSNQCVFDA